MKTSTKNGQLKTVKIPKSKRLPVKLETAPALVGVEAKEIIVKYTEKEWSNYQDEMQELNLLGIELNEIGSVMETIYNADISNLESFKHAFNHFAPHIAEKSRRANEILSKLV